MSIVKELYNTLLHNQNQFASGGMLLMVLGSIGAALRKVPVKIWDWIVDQTTLNITINDDNRAFWWLKHWFDSQRRMKKIRRVDVYNTADDSYVFNPAPGGHWMWYSGRPIHIMLTRNETKKDSWTARSQTFTIRTIGRNQKFLRRFTDAIFEHYIVKKNQKPELYRWAPIDHRWEQVTPYDPRPLKTVIMEDSVKTKLIKDIERFKDSKTWYTEMGIPYHRGYLFYGPPGTGKTSLVVGLSSHFQAKVYLLKLSEMTDQTLAQSVSDVESNGMVILEDVDCTSSTQVRDPNKPKEKEFMSVTLSGLLNVLDGIVAPSGVMFFMTTNYIESLDPALVRPGRADVKLFIGPATLNQKLALLERFFPGLCLPEEFIQREMTMAELQEELLKKKNEIEVAA